MAYNYSKHWLDAQADLVSDLVHLARSKDVAQVEFDDYAQADAFRFRVRNILASLALHYPHMKDVTQNIRTWKEIDQINSVMRIHVGTENNYRAASRATKTPRIVPMRLRGSRPTGPLTGSVSVEQHRPVREVIGMAPEVQPTNEPPTPPVDIFVFDDVLNLESARENIKAIMTVADLRSSQLIEFPRVDLSVDETKAMVEAMEDWAHDDSETTDGRVSKLVLRRRSTSDVEPTV